MDRATSMCHLRTHYLWHKVWGNFSHVITQILFYKILKIEVDRFYETRGRKPKDSFSLTNEVTWWSLLSMTNPFFTIRVNCPVHSTPCSHLESLFLSLVQDFLGSEVQLLYLCSLSVNQVLEILFVSFSIDCRKEVKGMDGWRFTKG